LFARLFHTGASFGPALGQALAILERVGTVARPSTSAWVLPAKSERGGKRCRYQHRDYSDPFCDHLPSSISLLSICRADNSLDPLSAPLLGVCVTLHGGGLGFLGLFSSCMGFSSHEDVWASLFIAPFLQGLRLSSKWLF
jgi:hypothetical protein